LRAFQRDHFSVYAAMWADPEVAQYLGGKPSTTEESWFRILRLVGHWVLMGFGYWAVYQRGSEFFVGIVGFGNFKREIDPPFGDAPELGYAFTSAGQRNGFATEAATAAIRWLERERGRERTVCMITLQNTRSIRLAEKLGYREYARAVFHDQQSILFERI
jgi:RimJ/RimL family protein N-acetyltransferase